MKNTIKDYSDRKIRCTFQLGDVDYSEKVIQNLEYVTIIEKFEEEIIISLAVQQIPEVIKELVSKNIAIYSVVQL